eukprot:902769-Pelagomonas_calceolata.AAC.5
MQNKAQIAFSTKPLPEVVKTPGSLDDISLYVFVIFFFKANTHSQNKNSTVAIIMDTWHFPLPLPCPVLGSQQLQYQGVSSWHLAGKRKKLRISIKSKNRRQQLQGKLTLWILGPAVWQAELQRTKETNPLCEVAKHSYTVAAGAVGAAYQAVFQRWLLLSLLLLLLVVMTAVLPHICTPALHQNYLFPGMLSYLFAFATNKRTPSSKNSYEAPERKKRKTTQSKSGRVH